MASAERIVRAGLARILSRSHRPRATTKLLLLSVLLAAVLAPPAARAQGGCEMALQSATDLFEEGRFDAAEEAIDQCLQGVPRRAEKVQAYALLAKIALAVDDLPAADAALARLLDADPEFEPALFDAPRFVRLVAEAKSRKVTPTVTSVSKSKESLLEAPATVVVITAEEIERRGYRDLEAVLHDLPGFDFSRQAGAPYANIYQRGYRSIETNRTLILVDGVEDNDLASSTAWISRQYPLSNIDRIEVVYGPASTMYGANAFAGVINVITKEPEHTVAERRRLGYDIWATGGSWSTGSVDATVAGRTSSGSMSWSFTARKYESNDFEHLSDYEQWDYDPGFYDGVNYQARSNLKVTDPTKTQDFLARYPDLVGQFFDVDYDDDGNPIALNLNAAGDQRARELDQAAYAQIVGGHPIKYSNPVDDWMVYGKLKTANLLFGLQMWRRMESGHVPLVDYRAATGDNGFLWTPEHLSLFMKYNRRYLDDKLALTLFTRYKRHELDGSDSSYVYLRSYHLGNLGVENLLDGTTAFWEPEYYYRSNDQLRAEVNAFYDHSESFNVVAGVELRYSSIGAKNVFSETPRAGETGYPFDIIDPCEGDPEEEECEEERDPYTTEIPGGNQISSRDLGAYAQASYRPWKPLKLVAGIRFDNNTIRDSGGYGTVFNPRLAAVYSWSAFIFKAIYSEAFQDVPNFQRFETTSDRQLDNPGLDPEEVSNLELSASWSPNEDLTLQLAGYSAEFKGIVEQVVVQCPPELGCEPPGTTGQFQNVGRLEVQGLQAEARWTPGRYRLLANYTYTDPFDPDRGVRVGDIADHRLNLIGETTFFDDRLDLSLRLNGVFGRKTGPGTTVSLSPYSKIDDYLIAHGTVTYRRILPGLDLQLAIENLLDEEYFDPALRNAPPVVVGNRIPQPRRIYFLRLRYAR